MAGGGASTDRNYSDFLKAVDSGEVNKVTIDGDNVAWEDQSGTRYTTTKPEDPSLVQRLENRGVAINVVPEHNENPILSILLSWFPMLLLIGVWILDRKSTRLNSSHLGISY